MVFPILVFGQISTNEEHMTMGADIGTKTRKILSNLFICNYICVEGTLEQQPRSAETPLSQQQNESENPEYKSLLERLRTYHSDVKSKVFFIRDDNS